ncbi:hypothetical protein WDZ16_00835 [Pseudokineococcus marinus]|uniref:Uncharacterized protein n=1 Tax=Pseudokineococcus marinus TaxID=351215 RepID=A0A849BR02_9ACTN|nr:hypothetical protein [Pseudokineococcus marinus]NNH23427.1 hypothetical protein [Pseudokineococcus marinus]
MGHLARSATLLQVAEPSPEHPAAATSDQGADHSGVRRAAEGFLHGSGPVDGRDVLRP